MSKYQTLKEGNTNLEK